MKDTNIITENIKKYNMIMSQYRNGEFGTKILSLYEILELANEKNLINEMSLYELQYLLDKSSGFTRLLFINAINNKMLNSKDAKKRKLKVKIIKK